MTFILYNRYFSLNESTGKLRTLWNVVGNKYNNAVELHETYPEQTLNCFNQNIASLYVFCKPLQCAEFEKRHLVDVQKQFGNNLKIFKFESEITIAQTVTTLSRNINNIKNLFSMETCTSVNIDTYDTKENISSRIVYKVMFNNERTRADLVSKMNVYNLTTYPDIEMFIPFDDECELFLNNIFSINSGINNTKYSYMTVIAKHYMSCVDFLESFHGIIQMINARNISRNILAINNREMVKNPKAITNMFLDNVPIVDIFLGRVIENEQCVDFWSDDNEITFIIIKMYIFKKSYYITLLNSDYQVSTPSIRHNRKLNNVVVCMNELDLLRKFFNMYTNGLIFNIINMDMHFILSSQRYKSNSYAILCRIILNNFWSEFSAHCVISEDGKCIRFNRNSIILFDNVDRSDQLITNNMYIDSDYIYMPHLYCDSSISIDEPLENLIKNVKLDKMYKYVEILKNLDEKTKMNTMSSYDLITKIIENQETEHLHDYYYQTLESIIELSRKIRVPITILYSLSLSQIAYRLIFYTYIRSGIFLIMDREENIPHFYESNDSDNTMNILKKMCPPKHTKTFENIFTLTAGGADESNMFQNLIKKFIPVHMTGNLIENYFTFFRPGPNHYPFISSIVDNKEDMLSLKYAIVWARRQLFNGRSIVSFDFALYHSSIIALFDLDFNNCAIMYGFELKSFYYNIFPTKTTFDRKRMVLLQLPYTFIMDNNSLEIKNMTTYEDIGKLENYSCYVVIMRFITTNMMEKYDGNYKTLSNLFQNNIYDIKKYKIRSTLHKNVLNSICGMLSAYQINTCMLHIVYAISRKIIMYTVNNCIDRNTPTESFLDHKYDINSRPPPNLISIESDSFTYIYEYTRFDYKNNAENLRIVDRLRLDIMSQLNKELATCTIRGENEIAKILNLKLNFATGNLMQISARRFFYLATNDYGKLSIVSNEKNNSNIQKCLKYLNMDDKLINTIENNKSIKLLYLKKTYGMTSMRQLLLWYLMQNCRTEVCQTGNNNPSKIYENFQTLNAFIESHNIDRKEIKSYMNLLFTTVRLDCIEKYFVKILTSPICNLHFLRNTIPEESVLLESIQMPSDKKLIVTNCVRIFFKLFQKVFEK